MRIKTDFQKPLLREMKLLMQDLRETNRVMKEISEKNRQESEAKVEKARQESEAKAKKAQQKSDKAWEDFRKSMKAMQKELGGITKSNGEMAESYFINCFTNNPQFAGQNFQFVDANTRRSSKALQLRDEYDLLLYNGVAVAIIEIKYKARKKDVEHLLKKTETFKTLFPQYKEFGLYLGLAALHFDIETEQESIERGVAVIKQVGKAMVINDAHLKVF
jgi:hypothetical protein